MQLRSALWSSILGLTLVVAGCGGDSDSGGSGGRPGGSGGVKGTGGTTAGSGGSTAGTGGAPGTGGAVGSGGAPGTGGALGTGGTTTGTGGAGSGGATGTGGGDAGRGGGGHAGHGGSGGGATGSGGRGGTGGRTGSGGGGGGTAATFTQVAMILGSSCGTGQCHNMASGHNVLVNDDGLYDRIVGKAPTGSKVMSACKTNLVVPNDAAGSLISKVVKAKVTGCTNAKMPDECPNQRQCLTMPQIDTIDSWIAAGAMKN